MKPLRMVSAASIHEGDAFLDTEGQPAWTAIDDAYLTRDNRGDEVVAISVQHHPDGGLDTRWFPVDMEWNKKFVKRANKENS